jgi:uncharacterized protein (TIGR02265 family)
MRVATQVHQQPMRSEARFACRSFEALLLLARPAPAPLLAAVRAAGFDPARPEESYPHAVWLAVFDEVRRHLFPLLEPAAGQRAIGRRYVEAYSKTVVGRVLASAAPLMGPDRALARLPGYLRTGTERFDMRCEPVGPGVWRLRVENACAQPEFCAGLVEGVLALVRAPAAQVTVARREAAGFDLLACWSVGQA